MYICLPFSFPSPPFLVELCADSFPKWKLWISNTFSAWRDDSNWASSETTLCNSSSGCTDEEFTSSRIFHFWLHLSGLSQTFLQCLVSLKLPFSQLKVSRLWNSFFLCMYTTLCLWEISGIPYRTCRICLMFRLVGGYIKVCIQLSKDTTFNTPLVPIYLSDISDGPDSKTGTAVRVCSPQRLLLFDVMRKVGLVHRVVIFQVMEEKSDCVPEVHGKKILAFSVLLSNLE